MTDPTLPALLGRYSLGAKHLGEPGPTDAQLDVMVRAALRAPDHGSLVPFRFSVIRGEARARFAEVLERAAREAGKTDASVLIDRERALRAPLTIAVIARIDLGHPQAPGHEQWMAVGGALSNFLTAAHALGFGGKMLSGAKARAGNVVAAFCEPGETLVGWIDLGTPQRAPSAREPKPHSKRVIGDWEPR